jgi:hypothetical protein
MRFKVAMRESQRKLIIWTAVQKYHVSQQIDNRNTETEIEERFNDTNRELCSETEKINKH